VKLLPWDSELFGRSIARLEEWDPHWRQSAEAAGVECLYFLARASDQASVWAAEQAGFRMVDIRITLERTLADAPTSVDPRLRLARPEDAPTLERIAEVSHRDTRFYADEHFDRARVDELYRTWIRKSCTGEAPFSWVVDRGGALVGYATGHQDGRIGLVAVSPEARGEGLGTALVEAVLSSLGAAGVPKASVVTQGRNLAGQRLYQHCRFVTAQVELWFHRWLEDRDPG
jgi:dTDP-4-amino-4,6-dideoxy-D-galactose acyltransferase